ncbi:MAG: ribulose-phosphate 3-epimerase [Microthrixaceae bacterium]|nr:ribulose-phosphate 3-epimerase [Microthrixaceae bacterium]
MSAPDIQISPSVLPADFSRLGETVQALEAGGADRIHWDVMDGVFVPNLTIGPDVIHSCRPVVEIPFEAHLMVIEADELIPRYVEAGCDMILVHQEACTHLHRTLSHIRDLGVSPGVVLNPATPATTIEHVMDLVDQILVMTVNPGFGGQAYLQSMEPKISQVAEMISVSGRDIDLEVDGGLAVDTVAGATAAGANVVVAGSAVFKDPEGFAHAIPAIRDAGVSTRS